MAKIVDEGCTCHLCGRKYKVDIMVPDGLWVVIKPSNSPEGAGLLCGPCITERMENINTYAAFKLTQI